MKENKVSGGRGKIKPETRMKPEVAMLEVQH
jgi:hypothetical protein